jgi:hypothetical protein
MVMATPSEHPPAATEAQTASRPAAAGADGSLQQLTPKTPVGMSAAQFVALIAAVVGGSYWVVSRMATKDDVAQLGLRVSKLEDSIQEVRTTLAVLKDRSDREQKKPNP